MFLNFFYIHKHARVTVFVYTGQYIFLIRREIILKRNEKLCGFQRHKPSELRKKIQNYNMRSITWSKCLTVFECVHILCISLRQYDCLRVHACTVLYIGLDNFVFRSNSIMFARSIENEKERVCFATDWLNRLLYKVTCSCTLNGIQKWSQPADLTIAALLCFFTVIYSWFFCFFRFYFSFDLIQFVAIFIENSILFWWIWRSWKNIQQNCRTNTK